MILILTTLVRISCVDSTSLLPLPSPLRVLRKELLGTPLSTLSHMASLRIFKEAFRHKKKAFSIPSLAFQTLALPRYYARWTWVAGPFLIQMFSWPLMIYRKQALLRTHGASSMQQALNFINILLNQLHYKYISIFFKKIAKFFIIAIFIVYIMG